VSKENGERRKDVGSKILIGLVLGGFGTSVGIFVNQMLITAVEGKELALVNRVSIVRLQENYKSIKESLDEIKDMLNRRGSVNSVIESEWRKVR